MGRAIVQVIWKKAEGHPLMYLRATKMPYLCPHRRTLLIVAFCLKLKLP
jgi:hypothetical protein